MDSGDDPDASDGQRKKKRYHRHTPRQIQQLEAVFKECPHPDEKQRMQLIRDLGLEPRQIKFWFQNRRTQMKVEELEGVARKAKEEPKVVDQGSSDHGIATTTTSSNSTMSSEMGEGGEKVVQLEVVVVGTEEAMLRVQTENVKHPPARLMGALRELEVGVHHASVASLKGVMVQDVVVRVPRGLRGGESLKTALLAKLEID